MLNLKKNKNGEIKNYFSIFFVLSVYILSFLNSNNLLPLQFLKWLRSSAV